MKEKNVWCSMLFKLKKENQNQIKNKKRIWSQMRTLHELLFTKMYLKNFNPETAVGGTKPYQVEVTFVDSHCVKN